MADASPKVRDIQLYHPGGSGARTFFDAEGNSRILRSGETYNGSILDADYDSLSDLEGSPPEGGEAAPVPTSESTASLDDFPDLDGLDRDQLLAVATNEGYSTMSADASEADIRTAIEEARAKNPAVEAARKAREEREGGETRPAGRRSRS